MTFEFVFGFIIGICWTALVMSSRNSAKLDELRLELEKEKNHSELLKKLLGG